MIVTEILGNLKSFKTQKMSVVEVKISPEDRLKQVVRLKADDGKEIGISLKSEQILSDGDVLGVDDGVIYATKCLGQDVLVITPSSISKMGFVAHAIGNRHAPALFEDDKMIVEYDYLIEEWLKELKIPFKKDNLVLKTPLKHSSHRH